MDDQEGLRRALCTLVAASGHDVHGAEDIAGAIAVLEHDAIDLVLTDFQLENEDGLELAASVRARWPTVRIALMSGALDDELQERARAIGINACITKPFPPSVLAQLIGAAAPPEAQTRPGP